MSRAHLTLLPPPPAPERREAVRAGVRIEIGTVVWMVVEAAVGIGAGVLAHSTLLTAFGIDSVIELITGAALLLRLDTEWRGGSMERVERTEHGTAWITGIGLASLCLYILITAGLALATKSHPETSIAGIVLAGAALAVMPILAWRKRVIARRLDSAALRADAACSLTCSYLAATLLLGLALNALFHLWWADAITTLAFLIWLVPEAREVLEGAREGRTGCGCRE